MRKLLFPILFFIANLFFILTTTAQTGWQWGINNTHGNVEAWPTVTDPFGNVIGAGYFGGNDTIYFGGIPVRNIGHNADLVVVKSDSSGIYQWAISTQNNNCNVMPIGLETDAAGNIYLLGMYSLNSFSASTFSIGSITLTNTASTFSFFDECYFIAKFSPAGSVLFAKNIAIEEGGGRGGIGIDDSGKVYVTGNMIYMLGGSTIIGSDTLFYSNNHTCFIAKYDSSGNPIWAKNPGGNNISSFSVTRSGNICYAGQYNDSLIIANDTLTGSGNFLVKINSNGYPVWASKIDANAGINALACDQFENIYVSGGMEFPVVFGHDTLTRIGPFGSSNALIAKFDSSGSFLWAHSAGGISDDGATGIATDIYGNVWICGEMSGGDSISGYTMTFSGHILEEIPGSTDPMYIAEYNGCGRFINAVALKSGGDDQMGISVDTKGDLYVCGDYYGTMIFSNDTLQPPILGPEVFFLAKYKYNVNNNNQPRFTGSTPQTLNICADVLSVPINSLLKVIDIDTGQLETLRVIAGPSHGILVASDTITSTGDTLTPSGLTYTPDSGFVGNDSFQIEIFDCCDARDSATIHVIVKPLPTAGTITSNAVNAFCIGEKFIVQDTTAGGVWSFSNNHVALSGDTVTAISPGNDTLFYTVTNACGTSVATDNFFVPPPLPSITGNLSVCVGDTAVLRDSVWGGMWEGGNLHVFVGDNFWDSGLVAGLSAGTAIITYSMDLGCATTAIVTVDPVPEATGNILQIKCYGDNNGSIAVTVNSSASPVQYLWSNGSTASSISSLVPGAYTLNITESATQCSISDTFQITQPDSLQLTTEVTNDLCHTGKGSINTIVKGGTTPYSYLWSNNATSNEITGLSAGTYTLALTDMNGCSKNLAILVEDSSCQPVIIHDGISPNGDGINDVWIIEGIQDYPKNKVQVFDKWGDMVFEKENYNNDWGGTGKNGLLADGTYFYLVKLNSPNVPGGKDNLTGSLLIKR